MTAADLSYTEGETDTEKAVSAAESILHTAPAFDHLSDDDVSEMELHGVESASAANDEPDT